MKKVFIILLLFAEIAWAQTPIGLYEGLMGNSGVAISESTAASFYNPSLLKDKTVDAYSLSANTFDRWTSRSSGTEISSTTVNPGYLSSIIQGDRLNHELYLINLLPSQVQVRTSTSNSSGTSRSEGNVNFIYLVGGYSMAWRSFPLALSYFGIYRENTGFFTTEADLLPGGHAIISSRSQSKAFDLGMSISSHLRFSSYSIGYTYRSRSLRLYQQRNGSQVTSTFGLASPTDYQRIESSEPGSAQKAIGETFVIGHGFKTGSVEFLTDTTLAEQSTLNHTYTASQSFGFRVRSTNDHQFLCGLQQELGSKIKYLGQSTYYSAGYSWKTRGLRSAIGAYFYQNLMDQNVSKMGLTFASEFAY